ncbi:SDR family oxidoreductase [bacterium]|nr:SDR family oxidoreductase [bacterium]
MGSLGQLKKGILVTGASGFMGGNLAFYLSSFCKVSGQFNKNRFYLGRVNPLKMDIAVETDVMDAISSNEFDWAIHLAAVTSPDICEKDREYAKKVNIKGTRHLVNYCNEKNIPIIYISTDLVFDGAKGYYKETDEPNPISFYGATKLEAEQIVLNGLDENVVCRIALSYGKFFSNTSGGALDKMLYSLYEGYVLNLFTDQFRTPLYSGEFCGAVSKLIAAKTQSGSCCGSRIYHLGGSERVSRYDFGKKIVSVFGYKSDLLNPISMDQIKSAAKRGKDCSLNCARAMDEFNYQPLSITKNLYIDKKLREGSR